MSAPTNRWTLMQALAWVATRDRAFVERLIQEQVGPDDHAVPVTFTQLTVRIRGAGFPAPPADVDRPLVDMIARGAVPADGEPGPDFDSRADRRPVDRAAHGCRIDSGRWDDPEGFYLEPEGEHQNKWYGVEVDVEALLREFPNSKLDQPNGAAPIRTPARNRGGRPEKYAWAAIEKHVMGEFEYRGLPVPEDPGWATQADVIRSTWKFCQNSKLDEPSEAAMKKRVGEWISKFVAKAHN